MKKFFEKLSIGVVSVLFLVIVLVVAVSTAVIIVA